MAKFNRKAAFALLAGVSIGSFVMPAYAQGAENDDSVLGDIVVTAQKREQNLQDIPLSI